MPNPAAAHSRFLSLQNNESKKKNMKQKQTLYKYIAFRASNQEFIKSKDLEIVSNCTFQFLLASLLSSWDSEFVVSDL